MSHEHDQLTQCAGSQSHQGGKDFSSHVVSYPLQKSCRCSSPWGCSSFFCGKQDLPPLPHLQSVFCFLIEIQPSRVQCLILNQDSSAHKTAAAFQVLLSQSVALCTCIFFLSSELHEGIPCLSAGKLLHPEPQKIALAIIPDTSHANS